MKIKQYINAPQLIIEVLSIILAVFLALAVNRWKENYDHEKTADIALKSIIGELKSNSKDLTTVMPLHISLRDTIQKISRNRKRDHNYALNFTPAFLKKTAWETAISTQAVMYMDYEIVSKLSSVYNYQEAYFQTNNNYIQSTFTLDYFDRSKENAQLEATYSIVSAFVALEELLLKEYSTTIKELENYD